VTLGLTFAKFSGFGRSTIDCGRASRCRRSSGRWGYEQVDGRRVLGIYILDSLKGLGYALRPTRMWIAFWLWFLGPPPVWAMASIPCMVSIEQSSCAAGISSGLSGWTIISTFLTVEIPAIGRPPLLVKTMAAVPLQSSWTQPDACRASSIKPAKTPGSNSSIGIAVSNRLPACLFNCEIGWNTRCARNLCNSNAAVSARSVASDAFWCASAARALASAAMSSDLRLNSFCRNPAIWPNLISIATPTATRPSATAEPHCSNQESYFGWMAAIATVAATPKNTNPPPNHAHDSQDSLDFSNSSSLALIMPFGRRHTGKGFRGFWIGISIGALMFVLLFAVWLGLGMPQ
jgi:hypothetical protein